jgi:hypothetical protein
MAGVIVRIGKFEKFVAASRQKFAGNFVEFYWEIKLN